MTLAADTTLGRIDTGDAGVGRHEGEIVDGWDIGGNANGGYLLALAGRAMADHAGRPDPVTVTAHYLSPGKAGPVSLDSTTIKSGKRFTTVRATLNGPEKPVITLVGAFGDLGSSDGELERIDATAPDLPPPDDCVRLPGSDGMPPPMMNRVDLRLTEADLGFATGQPRGELEVTGWLRLLDDEPLDTVALLMAVDAFPPTAFFGGLPVAWVPTVELTCHVRRRPVPGWLRCRFSTRFVSGGFLEEDGEIWDETGHLVAQSRQLALVPRAG